MADVGSWHRLPFEVRDGFGADNVSRSTLGSTMRCSKFHALHCSVPTLDDGIRKGSMRKPVFVVSYGVQIINYGPHRSDCSTSLRCICFSSVGLEGPASILRKDAPGCQRTFQTDVAEGVHPEEPTPALFQFVALRQFLNSPLCLCCLVVYLGAHSLHLFSVLSQLAPLSLKLTEPAKTDCTHAVCIKSLIESLPLCINLCRFVILSATLT